MLINKSRGNDAKPLAQLFNELLGGSDVLRTETLLCERKKMERPKSREVNKIYETQEGNEAYKTQEAPTIYKSHKIPLRFLKAINTC